MSAPRDRDPSVMPTPSWGEVVAIAVLFGAWQTFAFAARRIGRVWDWVDRQRDARP